jgi:hypothetical protein
MHAAGASSRPTEQQNGLCPFLFRAVYDNAREHGPNILDFELSRLNLKHRLLDLHHGAQDAIVALQGRPTATPGRADDPAARGNFFFQSRAALEHGAEQLEFLVSRGLLPADFTRVAAGYRASVGLLPGLPESERAMYDNPSGSFQQSRADGGAMVEIVFVPTMAMAELQRYFHNTLIYMPPPLPLAVAASAPVLKRGVDWESVQDGYLNGDIVVIDGVLADWALEAAYRFCLEATVFYEHKTGSVGAYAADGLYADVFERIARALREHLPRVILDEDALFNFWAYKYHNTRHRGQRAGAGAGAGGGRPLAQQGISLHADKAKVNVNMWLTPDDANMEPDSGGLDVWKGAPVRSEAEFTALQDCNDDACRNGEPFRARGGTKVRVPYRRNRMVLFDSSLAHATSPIRFKTGYANRRINLTWLFGLPAWAEPHRRAGRARGHQL